ncbi:glycosyltransferase family 2 protein [Candidatus Uhrbacteria bacterium]|nr:glycosyltransferase family 2 protein [Candidatus Uhrbacteria bacterium]
MLVSIIIPVYNHAKELEACVESILEQSIYSNVLKNIRIETEIIIVNDGSTDTIADCRLQIADLLQRKGFSIQWIDQQNRGAAAARNRGFDACNGDLLFFCDADIRLEPDCLEKMWEALEQHPDAAFSYSQFLFSHKKFSSFPFDLATLRQLNYIHTSSLLRRGAFPRFDESLKKFQDWDLFLTIAERGGRGVFIPEVLYTIATGGTMSQWVPSFAYHAPFKYLPWWKKTIERYQAAKNIIIRKHNI